MKTLVKFALIFLCTTAINAQQGINYKAVIKDGSGNILTSQAVDVQFIIYEGAALTNNVYQESHAANTDANGIVSLNIGEGTTVDVFADVAWGNDEHWLNVQVDTGAGLVDMGTTQFMAVPYALAAKSVAGKAFNSETGVTHNTNQSDDFVFGSTQLDDDGSISSDDSRMFFNKTKSAFRAGLVDDFDHWDDFRVGLVSAAFGINTQASGDYSFAAGFGSYATNFTSFAFGDETVASGVAATAMGKETLAQSNAGTAIGRYNVGGGNATTWIVTDPLFEVGNGMSNGNRSNALTILKNGTITAPTLTNALIDTAGDKSLITKEYMALNGSTGLGLITENFQTGWRLRGRDPSFYGDIGNGAVDFSYSILTSSTYGATGIYSLATGSNAKALGSVSTAMGSNTEASGNYATSMGFGSKASGDFATSMGARTNAESQASLAIGRFNLGTGSQFNWIATDPLFEIGNGTDELSRSNALTVLKNGTITAPTLTNSLIDIAGNKALITKEYADSNYKSAGTVIKKYTISASAFNSSSPEFVLSGSSVRLSSGSGILYAPVLLPVGATIIEVKVYIYDNDANNIDVRLIRNGASIIQTQFTLSTVGSSSQPHILTWSNPIEIMNDDQYYFQVQPPIGNVWSGTNISLLRIRIVYTE